MSRARLMDVNQFETDTWNLERGELAKIAKSEEKSVEIRVLAGVLWLTSEGRFEDIVLEAGDCIRVSGLVNVLVEALSDATIHWSVGEGSPLKKERSDTPSRRNPASGGFRAASSPAKDNPCGLRAPQYASPLDRKDGRIRSH